MIKIQKFSFKCYERFILVYLGLLRVTLMKICIMYSFIQLTYSESQIYEYMVRVFINVVLHI